MNIELRETLVFLVFVFAKRQFSTCFVGVLRKQTIKIHISRNSYDADHDDGWMMTIMVMMMMMMKVKFQKMGSVKWYTSDSLSLIDFK